MSGWRWALQLLLQDTKCLAHLRIAQMHFAEEVIRQTTIVIQTTKVCAAYIADL